MWTEIRDLSDNTLAMFIHLGWSLKKNKKNADSGTCSSAMYFYLDELEEADSGYSPPADQSYVQHLALESFSPAPFCTTYGSNQQISLYCKKKKLFKREKKKKKKEHPATFSSLKTTRKDPFPPTVPQRCSEHRPPIFPPCKWQPRLGLGCTNLMKRNKNISQPTAFLAPHQNAGSREREIKPSTPGLSLRPFIFLLPAFALQTIR